MPIYEYACKECGNRFEKMQPITAEPLTECPSCGKSAIHRVFHPVGVIFKGSGWYITDSRKSDDKAGTAAPRTGEGTDKETSPTADKTETTGEAKSDSKSDAKSESSGGESSSPGASTVTKKSDT
jgi:putative FmdB family regulatory protein